jgi:hypothetical protein
LLALDQEPPPRLRGELRARVALRPRGLVVRRRLRCGALCRPPRARLAAAL